MTVTLTPEQERIVNAQLATGQFASRDEVIQAALLQFEQQYANLKADIAAGMDDIAHGRVAPLDVSATLARVRARQAAGLGEATCES